MIRTMIAAAALAASAAAQADVVYEWQTTEPGNVPAFGAQLRVDDAAWSPGGSLDYTWQFSGPCTGQGVPDSAACRADASALVTRFVFDMAEPGAADIDFNPRTGTGLQADVNPPLIANITFQPDGGLSGSLYANNDGTEVRLLSRDGLWGIDVFGSDSPNVRVCDGLSTPGRCTTAGVWVLDAATIPDGVGQVPVPGILPLMALASVGLGLSLRRRTRPAA